jgi:hypothetical protein
MLSACYGPAGDESLRLMARAAPTHYTIKVPQA